jgi:4-hydroxy-2-oxoheptanedioate aldolase
MATGNSLKEAWAVGRKTFGAWLTIPSSLSAELVAEVRPDYVCVDQQHGAVDYGSMVPMLQAIRAAGATAITRVAGNDASLIMKSLDAGALGVIVPLVSSGAEAARAVAACRYPPTGIRSYGPVRAAHVLGSVSPSDLAEGVVCLVMVETREGLDRVEEIAATPGLDGIYVGPADLALSLGLSPSFDSAEPEHVEAIRRVREACATHGVVAGIHCGSGEQAKKRAAEGFDMMTVGIEAALMVDGVRRELRKASGGEVGGPVRTTAGYS